MSKSIEPDPTYTFTKPLSKKTSGYTKHEVYMECTVSSNLAQVTWYKGKTKLEVRTKLVKSSKELESKNITISIHISIYILYYTISINIYLYVYYTILYLYIYLYIYCTISIYIYIPIYIYCSISIYISIYIYIIKTYC